MPESKQLLFSVRSSTKGEITKGCKGDLLGSTGRAMDEGDIGWATGELAPRRPGPAGAGERAGDTERLPGPSPGCSANRVVTVSCIAESDTYC